MASFRRVSFTVAVLVFAVTMRGETLDEILAKHVEAKGGIEALASIETLRSVGKLWLNGQASAYVLEWKRPDKMRRTFEMFGREFPQAFDGRTGWSISPHGGDEAAPMSDEELDRVRATADYLEGELVGHQTKGHVIKLLGSEEIDGRPSFKLEVTRKGGGRVAVYLDAERYLVVRRELKEKLPRGPATIETTYSDYRRVGGVMMPFRTEALIRPDDGPASRQTIVIESMTPNVEIDDSRFAMPR